MTTKAQSDNTLVARGPIAKKRFNSSGDVGSEAAKLQSPHDTDKVQTCLLVLGMHRSGTSMLARILNLAGYSLPNDLIGATATNPFGHWEPQFMNDRNQILLENIGSDWSDWGNIDTSRLSDDVVATYQSDLLNWVDAELEGKTSLILKEPRTCRLAPLVLPVLEEAGLETRVIIPYRNPLEVARSLQKRDDIDMRKAILLWIRHVVDAEVSSRGTLRSFVDYDALMVDWQAELSRMADDLGLDNLAKTENFAKEVDAFISKKDRHHRSDDNTLRETDYTAGMALRVLEALSTFCEAPESVSAQVIMDAVGQQLDEAARLTQPAMRAVERDFLQSQQDLTALEENHRQLSHSHREMRVQNAAYLKEITELHASTSWRITAPLRSSKEALLKTKHDVAKIVRASWNGLPLSQNHKEKLKELLLPRLKFAIGSTGLYKNWEAAREQRIQIEQSLMAGRIDYLGADEIPDAALIRNRDYFLEKRAEIDLVDPKARLIAFYLPQFHTIPENDEWWGPGFTEWTNVRPATAKFPDHYQPHEPIEVGYYDLLDTETQARQIALAKQYGIGGFCFYWYWFSGSRLLEKPVENWLNNPDLDFPFCICWANENWSRRWDGRDADLLMAQDHSPEDDLAFIAEAAPYLRDPRYIRIDGKPLLLLYRPSLLPDVAKTAARWRKWCHDNGVGDIYLAYPQSFESADPAEYGFDAAIEFPPNNHAPTNITDQVQDLDKSFNGIVYDWRSYVERSRDYPMPDYKLFRSVCPSWDNTARRKMNGTIFANSNPGDYRVWLENAVTRTIADAETPDERIIFCNAWNEWAEGAHLEPDSKYGYAYLDATRAALNPKEMPRTITLVGHDAHPHGAQILLLNLARSYAANGFSVHIILMSGGALIDEYRGHAKVTVLDYLKLPDRDVIHLLRRVRREDDQVAIVNTTTSATIMPLLKEAGYRVVSLIHEMTSVYDQLGLRPQMELVADQADLVVFPAPIVREHFESYLGRPVTQATIRPQGLYLHRPMTDEVATKNRVRLRSELGIDEQTCTLLGVGYVDHRKGGDLFIRAVADLHNAGRKVRGIWIGHFDVRFMPQLEALAAKLGVAKKIQFLGRQSDPQSYYAAADIFLLTSREDPYPSVVLEAMSADVPVVMFSGATGSEQLAEQGFAVAVAPEDPAAMARAVADLLDAPESTAQMTAAARAHIRDDTDFTSYSLELVELSGRHIPRVSVIVPNYNYARYIEARLDSVLAQDFPIYEIIILDDCSTDDSLQVINDYAARADRPIRVIPNSENSGSVFRQWIKGLELASGDYVWIAEADDLALPDFLSTVMRGFDAPNTVLSYTESAQIDENGRAIASDYRYYTDTISKTHWAQNYVHDGKVEVTEALYLKNTIPNVSAVVMRAQALADVLAKHREELESVRFVGDWLVYLWLLETGSIAFNAASKNIHRRHQNSVTISNFDAKQLNEIKTVQKTIQERHELDEIHKSSADAYLDELAVLFNLTGETAN